MCYQISYTSLPCQLGRTTFCYCSYVLDVSIFPLEQIQNNRASTFDCDGKKYHSVLITKFLEVKDRDLFIDDCTIFLI